MQRSGSQKFLLVIGIINIVLGAWTLLGAAFFLVGGSALMGDPAATAQVATETGLGTAEVQGLTFGLGFAGLFSGIVEIILGILGVRAANDANKIMPVWVLAVISLIMGIISIVMSLTQGHTDASSIGSYVGTLAGAALMLWVANNVKRQAGK